ncbi:hypothetical protein [Kineosporia sp. NBRC 101731]|uniref:hypothetical protein n=1 Tax=Kineosporia sp. NBRC 101731 TaxID=3032199 RepID=UPI002557925A|nr:hypothetical protein [Kineosporia sp. NBRC 101731]
MVTVPPYCSHGAGVPADRMLVGDWWVWVEVMDAEPVHRLLRMLASAAARYDARVPGIGQYSELVPYLSAADLVANSERPGRTDARVVEELDAMRGLLVDVLRVLESPAPRDGLDVALAPRAGDVAVRVREMLG